MNITQKIINGGAALSSKKSGSSKGSGSSNSNSNRSNSNKPRRRGLHKKKSKRKTKSKCPKPLDGELGNKTSLQKILMSQVKPGITKYTLFMIIINGHSLELESKNGIEQEANKDFRLPLDILFLNGIYAGCTTLKGGFNRAELNREMLKTINKGKNKKKGYDNFQLSKTGEKTENYNVIFNRGGNASISEPYNPINNATGIIRCDPIDLELTENCFNLKDIIPNVYVDLDNNKPTDPRVPETETLAFMDLESILLKLNKYYDFLEREAVEPGTGILKLVMCCYCRGDLAPVGSNNNITNFDDSANSNFNKESINRAILNAFTKK